MIINDSYTSTGAKFFAHQEAMKNLQNGKGQAITTHVMLCDYCQHQCAFCSVASRPGDSLAFDDVMAYLDILLRYGLKSVILSGGGNPILYKCKKTGKNFNDVVDAIHAKGLEIGLITNGMPLKEYYVSGMTEGEMGMEFVETTRKSWKTVHPETLGKLTWIRISMAGLDHTEREVYVPDIDPTKTTLGFSYVAHDVWTAPEDPHHGKVSTEADMLSLGVTNLSERKVWRFEDRIDELTETIALYVGVYKPKYVRLLPNCLEPSLIPQRCEQLERMAKIINMYTLSEAAFVQQKPPRAPKACFLGYIHPVLNSDGYVLPCDSCCLNESSGHKLGEAWRICHWSEIASIYEAPVRSLIKDPKTLCPGCVFTKSNEILGAVVDGTADITPPLQMPTHVNFV